MQKIALLSLALFANCSAALAATPVFQLHESDARSQLRAIDSISPKPVQEAALRDVPMPSHAAPSASRGGAFISNVLYNPAINGGWSYRRADAGIMPVGNSTYADYGDVPRNADDSLFYFLKNFKARPLQKPASGTMLLVGLCFVLYQMRRRPMRSSIAFNSAAKLMGRRAA